MKNKLNHANLSHVIQKYVENKNELGKLRFALYQSISTEKYEQASWINGMIQSSSEQTYVLEQIIRKQLSRLKKIDLDYLFEYQFLENLITLEPRELEYQMLTMGNYPRVGVFVHGLHIIYEEDHYPELNLNRWPAWNRFLKLREKRIENDLVKNQDRMEELNFIKEKTGRNPIQILIEE